MFETVHCKSFEEMNSKAAQVIVKEITNSKKQFSLALPGGNSVKGILEKLAKQNIWNAVNVFMVDERMVPIDSEESNFKQANDLFFSKVKGIHTNSFEVEKGIDDYNKKFDAIKKFDLVVLGVGEDGHVASLFPNHESIKSKEIGFIKVKNAPKEPKARISLSPKSISDAKLIIFLFASESKKNAYKKFADEKTDYTECPAKISMNAENVLVFTVFGDEYAE
ncbi:MAG: 6-phosphogluconolactonase [archaeon]|nr:6-phosphogluconolactonase [archaeon]